MWQLRRLPRPDVNMGTLLRRGSRRAKEKYLPKSPGRMAPAVHGRDQPTITGTDTCKIKTSAVKKDGRYVINGQKVLDQPHPASDFMILLARTTPLAEVTRRKARACPFRGGPARPRKKGMTGYAPSSIMVNHETNELFFEDLEIPEENLIGERKARALSTSSTA